MGLYLNPPDKVLGLALERLPAALASPKLALPAGNPRNRPAPSANLLGALEELEAQVVGGSRWRPRQHAFLSFLRGVEREVSAEAPIHLVMDRQGTHTQDFAQAWLKRRPRMYLHPAPAGGTWFTWAAYWLAQLSRRHDYRGSFPGSEVLEPVIRAYLASHPTQPEPFAWPGARKKSLP